MAIPSMTTAREDAYQTAAEPSVVHDPWRVAEAPAHRPASLDLDLARADVGTLTEQQLTDAITELSAHLNAAEYRLIELIGEWDERGTRSIAGSCTIAQWLGFQCGIDGGAAREKVRVARALRALPKLRACFARGEVSYSKIRAVTRIATPENEGLLLGYSTHATAAQMERIVRGYRSLDRVADPERVLELHTPRGLSWYTDEDGMVVIHGRFPPEDGAVILKAIEQVMRRMKREEQVQDSPDRVERMHGKLDEEAENPAAARRADAFVQLAEAGMAADPASRDGGDRTLVVLHVPTPIVGSDSKRGASENVSGTLEERAANVAQFEDGTYVPDETTRRLCCDASVVVQQETAKGEVLSIGRRSRTVPHWLRRVLLQRDGGCRFPGCTRRHHLDAHHVEHWADGGETSADNLVLLCRQHHRAIHEGGWTCRKHADGEVEFVDPSGAARPETFPQKRGRCADLQRHNAARGLRIDRHTCTAGYDGRRVNYGDAVNAVWQATHGTQEIHFARRRRD